LGFDLLQESNFKRFVEVGRGASIIHSLCITKTDLSHQLVVLLKAGPYAGKIAVIAEIIDHNRVCRTFHPTFSVLIPPQALIDGPTTSVPRQPFPNRHLSLTPLALTKLPRAASSGVIKKQLEKEGTIEQVVSRTLETALGDFSESNLNLTIEDLAQSAEGLNAQDGAAQGANARR